MGQIIFRFRHEVAALSPEPTETLSLNALRGLVTGLLERSQQAEARLAKLETETVHLRAENATLRLKNACQKNR